ncbi:hypothetical protein D3C80_1482720 [compost metagenome]
MTEYQAFAGIGLQLGKAFPRNAGIFVHRGLGWQVAPALAKATVIHGQHRVAHGMQLLDAEQLAGKVPAHAVQVEHRRGIGAFGRPPPGVQALVIAEAARAQVKLLHVAGQTAEPAGLARFDAEHQFALLVLQHGAAGG